MQLEPVHAGGGQVFEARAEAFLQVPLYKAIFEKYRGYTLPPASALEREMVNLGVASKQTDKARQAFMRSARQAGFFVHGEDRLVRPSGPTVGPGTKPIENDLPKKDDLRSGGGGGDDKPPLDPLLRGLVDRLPPADSEWSLQDRVKWLQTAANIFDLIYKGDGGIKIEAAISPRSPRPE